MSGLFLLPFLSYFFLFFFFCLSFWHFFCFLICPDGRGRVWQNVQSAQDQKTGTMRVRWDPEVSPVWDSITAFLLPLLDLHLVPPLFCCSVPSSCWINPSSTFSYLMIWLVSHSILFMSLLLCHDFHFLCWFSFPSFYILLMPSASSTSCHGSRLMSIIYLLLYPPPTLPSSTCSLFLPPVLFIYSAGCDGWWIFWRAFCCLKPGRG